MELLKQVGVVVIALVIYDQLVKKMLNKGLPA